MLRNQAMTPVNNKMSCEPPIAKAFAVSLKRNGVRYVFGMPGGGSSIDLIEACRAEKIQFVLVQHETTAALMAIVCGELTESCGVCISIMGTGAINLAGGATYAFLERHPLLCVTETYSSSQSPLISMQKIDHGATFKPYCKDVITLGLDNPGKQIDDAIKLAKEERPGPVHVDYPHTVESSSSEMKLNLVIKPCKTPIGDLVAIAKKINLSEKPLIIAGPAILRQHAKNNLLHLVGKIGCAVMVTSKARGVIPEDHPLYAGVISGVYDKNTLEGRMVNKSDLILGIGLDRAELLSPWKHQQPLLMLDAVSISKDESVGTPMFTAWGHLPKLLDSLSNIIIQRQTWQINELQNFWIQAMSELEADNTSLNATNVLVHARKMSPRNSIITTEAGIYGRVNLYAWQVYEENTYFDSSGANTMGYSIPAALATTLLRPDQKTICLVGDGGFLMRAGELETASRLKLAPIIIIFDDAGLGMIRIKQKSKKYARQGVDLKQTDFVHLTESFNGIGRKVSNLKQFDKAFADALKSDQLHVIDVRLDADVYASHIKPIRGI